MNLLLDTHAFLLDIWGSEKLSPAASQAFLERSNTLYLSAVSYWEICIKHSIGKLALATDWQAVFDREMEANGIRRLGLEKEHCQGVVELPAIHGDPFDRLLVSQARREGLVILTQDKNIGLYGVETLW